MHKPGLSVGEPSREDRHQSASCRGSQRDAGDAGQGTESGEVSYSHLVDQAIEMSASSSGTDQPAIAALDFPRLQGLMGRNLMVYQDLESLMKELAFAVHLFVPLEGGADALKLRRERIQKLTLGGTVDDVMRLFDPYDEAVASGNWLEIKLSLQWDTLDKDAERRRFAEVIAERNWLVHNSLRELCYSSDPQIRADAGARIEHQHAAAVEFFEVIRGRWRDIVELRKDMIGSFRSVGIPMWIFQKQAQALLADPKALKATTDGSFLLERMVDLIRVQGPLSSEGFKTLRGIGFEALLQHIEPRLTFEDRRIGERLARFAILPAE